MASRTRRPELIGGHHRWPLARPFVWRAGTARDYWNDGLPLSALLVLFGAATLLGQVKERSTIATVSDPLRTPPIVNVQEHRIICDGRTDDSEALQSVLDAAAGGVADLRSLPGGTCLLSRALTPRSRTRIIARPGSVILKPTLDNKGDVLLLRVSDKANVSVFGLTFDGGGRDFDNPHSLVRLERSANVVFDRVAWQHTRGIALVAEVGVTNSGVRRSRFTDVGNRWMSTRRIEDRKQAVAFCCGAAPHSHGNFVQDCEFRDVGLDAVSVTENTSFRIINNRFHMENGQLAIEWKGPQPNAFGAAIYAANSVKLAIVGNMADQSPGNGIDVVNVMNAEIERNAISYSGSAGIGCFKNSSCTIRRNVVKGNGQWKHTTLPVGIAFRGAHTRVELSKNLVYDDQSPKTQLFGLYASDDASFDKLTVEHNNRLENNGIGALGGTLDRDSRALYYRHESTGN